MSTDQLPVVYTAEWCGYCRRLKAQLDREGIAYDQVDVDASADGLARLEALSDGAWVIPTVEFADGTALVNPSAASVAAKLAQAG